MHNKRAESSQDIVKLVSKMRVVLAPCHFWQKKVNQNTEIP